MDNQINICGDDAVFLPELPECDECEVFEARLSAIEELLEGMARFEIEKTDEDGNTVKATIIGIVEHIEAETDDSDDDNNDDTDNDDTSDDNPVYDGDLSGF